MAKTKTKNKKAAQPKVKTDSGTVSGTDLAPAPAPETGADVVVETVSEAAPDTPAASEPERQAMLWCRDMRFPRNMELLPKRVRMSLRTGSYEQKEADAALRLIRKGDVVLELGAGIGFMSTLISTQTRAREVHSFEANPGLLDYIHEVHRLNRAKKAHLHHAVLGDKDGTTTFYCREDILSSSLDPEDGGADATPAQVPMRDANKVIAEIKPTVLVCDIEGAEADLLPKLDLSGLRALLIELHPQWIGSAGIKSIFQLLHDQGLVYFPKMSFSKVAVFRSDW
ncbi:hypothetical protein TRL7639_01604 [Falsiruegeria litorea R37]|uniref:TRM5/TYW2-like methyltransferase domain-containing protein n=1 Tax=Falsiruegeria litorea R37 TaxID=1200284 RepID=A0A1Y5SCY5_9RHOB|nr:FkbM family methyltransferase [Falsiruegeria litorea]SLN34759.1 hypothetical protein TRL7639_01604 [Falsiruegeria litorea R37]